MESATHYRNGKSKAKNPRKIIYENPDWIRKNVKESKALKKFLKKRIHFEESSEALYVSHVTTYCYFHQKLIDELIEEYKKDIEEFDGDDEEELKVYNDVLDYIKHAVKNKQAKSTIQGKEKRIRTFLKDNGISFPKIYAGLKTYDDSEGYYTKKDLPDKETMKTAINGANPKHKAIFAWVYTTGSGRSETANLTIKNFLDGIQEFCNSTEPKEIIKEIDGNTIQEKIIDGETVKVPVVPLIRMKRQKTKMPYYTVTTPECVQIIIDYIKTDLSILDNLDKDTKLFGIQAGAVGNAFKDTNLKYGWGKRGRYNFFGCHRLRHNHYTEIDNQNLANSLEGRVVNDKNDKTYNQNLDDPEYLRNKYKEHMHKFEIFDRINMVVNDEQVQKLQNELEEARKKNADLIKRLEDVEKNIETIEQGLSDLSPNELKPNIIREKISEYIQYNNEQLDINTDDIAIVKELATTLAIKHEKIYNDGKGIKELIGKAKFELILDKTLKKTLSQNIKEDEKLIEHVQSIWTAVMNYVEKNDLKDVIGGENEGDKLISYLLDTKEKYAKSEITDELIIEVLKGVMYYDDVRYY